MVLSLPFLLLRAKRSNPENEKCVMTVNKGIYIQFFIFFMI